jgi:hypothetical protein
MPETKVGGVSPFDDGQFVEYLPGALVIAQEKNEYEATNYSKLFFGNKPVGSERFCFRLWAGAIVGTDIYTDSDAYANFYSYLNIDTSANIDTDANTNAHSNDDANTRINW